MASALDSPLVIRPSRIVPDARFKGFSARASSGTRSSQTSCHLREHVFGRAPTCNQGDEPKHCEEERPSGLLACGLDRCKENPAGRHFPSRPDHPMPILINQKKNLN
jgi:hypothetical protein